MKRSLLDVAGGADAAHEEELVSLLGGGRAQISARLAYGMFAFFAVMGQVGVNISLPLLSDSVSSGSDPYFVLLWNGTMQTLIFGAVVLVLKAATSQLTPENTTFPHRKYYIMGLCQALNGVLVVYASPSNRTPPILQAVLGSFTIPMTVALRIVYLRAGITKLQAVSALVVMIGVFVSLVPTLFGIAGSSGGAKEATGAGKYLWPVCFMLGFTPAVVLSVLQERGLKSGTERSFSDAHARTPDAKRILTEELGSSSPGSRLTAARAKSVHSAVSAPSAGPEEDGDAPAGDKNAVHVMVFLFWINAYQLLNIFLLFWTDAIPGFGESSSVSGFFDSIRFGFACVFGKEDACEGGEAAQRAFAFAILFGISGLASGLLTRHPEGANYVALVQSLVAPIAAMWWTLFNPDPLFWKPHYTDSSTFALVGLLCIVPGVFFYNKTRQREAALARTKSEYDPEVRLSTNRATSVDVYPGSFVTTS